MTLAYFTNIVNYYFPEPHASLLNGMLFGTPIRSVPSFYTQVKIVGLLHLVVLSGTNITIMINTVGSIVKYIGIKYAIVICTLTIVLFVIMVKPQPPIIRATIMGLLTLYAIWFGRQYTALYALCLSLIVTGIFWPQWLSNLSLYLSYSATLGILLFGKPIYQKRARVPSFIINLLNNLKTTLAAQLFTTPLIFFYFHQISYISPLSNLLIGPFVTPIMIFGFATVFAGTINKAFGYPFYFITYGLLEYMVQVIRFLSKIPGAFVQFGK